MYNIFYKTAITRKNFYRNLQKKSPEEISTKNLHKNPRLDENLRIDPKLRFKSEIYTLSLSLYKYITTYFIYNRTIYCTNI